MQRSASRECFDIVMHHIQKKETPYLKHLSTCFNVLACQVLGCLPSIVAMLGSTADEQMMTSMISFVSRAISSLCSNHLDLLPQFEKIGDLSTKELIFQDHKLLASQPQPCFLLYRCCIRIFKASQAKQGASSARFWFPHSRKPVERVDLPGQFVPNLTIHVD